jgi:hypothetical protein
MMNLILGLLVVTNLGVAALLWQRFQRMSNELAALRIRQDGLGADIGLNLRTPAGAVPMISVAVLNVMELARQESQLARAFGHLTPKLVQREVYREIHRRLSQQLREQGVVAEVTLHHAD